MYVLLGDPNGRCSIGSMRFNTDRNVSFVIRQQYAILYPVRELVLWSQCQSSIEALRIWTKLTKQSSASSTKESPMRSVCQWIHLFFFIASQEIETTRISSINNFPAMCSSIQWANGEHSASNVLFAHSIEKWFTNGGNKSRNVTERRATQKNTPEQHSGTLWFAYELATRFACVRYIHRNALSLFRSIQFEA